MCVETIYFHDEKPIEGAEFIDEIETVRVIYKDRNYVGKFVVDEPNVRLVVNVGTETLRTHAPQRGKPARDIARCLMEDLIRANHERFQSSSASE